ncbi:unnamed protein product [Rotaria sp. Silwood1]|nr:unnamed protein product [Rotaria sp. Silwood1]
MSPVEQLEELGSCSANAVAGVLEYLIKRKYNIDMDVSRLFIYYNARRIDYQHSSFGDSGATLTGGVRAVRKYGVCDEKIWPYDIKLVNKRPGSYAYRAARRYTARPVRVPINLPSIKTSLANGLPVTLSLILSESADSESKQNGGYISIPNLSTTTVNNSSMHSIVICGYDERTQHFLVRNSWGEQWVNRSKTILN